MKESAFVEKDIVGEGTLQVLSKADNFNAWMYGTIRPYLKGKVLEIGSGIGNISQYLLNDGFQITLSDLRPSYCEKLQRQFDGHPSFQGTLVMDLTDPLFDEKFGDRFNSFETVFALNVVEHIHNDALAVQNCRKLLKSGGHLIILVPAYNFLFNRFDTELGHYRRYTTQSLAQLISKQNFSILHRQYFNVMGIPGWYLNGRLLQKQQIPGNQMRIFNALVPVFKLVDGITFNSFGLSAIAVGRKR